MNQKKTKNRVVGLILGDQLFEDVSWLEDVDELIMIESFEEASRLNYHKFRLVYLFCSMREYAEYLKNKFPNLKIRYTKLKEKLNFEKILKKIVGKVQNDSGVQDNQLCQIQIKTPKINDKYFKNNLLEISKELNFRLIEIPNDQFLSDPESLEEFKLKYIDGANPPFKMHSFYLWQRKRLKILVSANKKPIGGQWSFDKENRKKIPKNVEIPNSNWGYDSKFYDEVKSEVEELFPNNPGKIESKSWLPLNHSQAKKLLQDFFETYLTNFGDYEDALTTRSDFNFHSTISPLLNNGLLTPRQVLNFLHFYLKEKYGFGLKVEIMGSKEPHYDDFPLNSVEGFVRQIIGWREWMKFLYDYLYEEDFRKLNFFNSKKPLPKYFYYPEIATEEEKENFPLFHVLQKVERLSWAHHIERLMILGNWMMLNEYDPAECYDWFVSQFVDGYEWVMVGNVFGMALYADGGLFATKPYAAGGNYLKKMSDYPNSKTWEKLWTDKFWYFVEKHEEVFSKNPRMNMLLKAREGKK